MTTKKRSLAHQLQSTGFDVVHPFPLQSLSESSREAIGCSVNIEQIACGVLVGNTASVWQPFLLWLHQQSEWQRLHHPFNTYSEYAIQTSCAQVYTDHQIFWVHETKSYVLPIQKIAHEIGLAFLSAGHFNIHPQFGPWFALRALVLLPTEPAPTVQKAFNPSDPSIELQAARLFQQLYQQTMTSSEAHPIQNHWRSWLTLRDLYEVGRGHRYSEEQIQYHYTHDRTVLESGIERLTGSRGSEE